MRFLFREPAAPRNAGLNALFLPQPTETERCIESLLAVFQRYAGREGDNHTLSKREFLAFMNSELAAFTKVSKIWVRRNSRGALRPPGQRLKPLPPQAPWGGQREDLAPTRSQSVAGSEPTCPNSASPCQTLSMGG